MKVKRFDNLWTMGLILTGAILVLFYIAKIFFPEWIVGVAEVPSIVKFGNYVDSHKWAYQLYEIIFGFFIGYIYCCACIRTYKLNWKGNLFLILSNLVLNILAMFSPQYYAPINYVNFVLIPLLICLANKNITKDIFVSTVVCFAVDIFLQILSMEIRDITLLSTHLNSATYTILLIDMVIWRVLLYMFFNYKNKKGDC